MSPIDQADLLRKRRMEEPETGPALLEQAILEPTLDEFLDRDPKMNLQPDYVKMVDILHREREMFISAQQKRKEKKNGESDDDE